MMISWCRLSLTACLIGALIGAPQLALAEAASNQHAQMERILSAETPSRLASLGHLRFGSSSELKSQAKNITKAAGGVAASMILSDVIQATIILGVAVVAQTVKSRMERDHLLNGQSARYVDVKRETEKATEDLFCAQSGIGQEILCSGEMFTSVLGGLVARSGVEVLSATVLSMLLKSTPTRSLLMGIISAMASSFIMITGFSMAGYLWTQAVNFIEPSGTLTYQERLVEQDKIREKAKGLFGRAIEMKINGRWAEYIQTPDGQLAQQAFQNMYDILLTHPEMRSTWIYNSWRFGVLRGEMITTVLLLVSAMETGTALGPAVATRAAQIGITSSVGFWSFVIASVFGAVASAAIVWAPDLGFGETLTKAIQSTRAWLSQRGQERARMEIRGSLYAFDTRYKMAQYQSSYETRLLTTLLPALKKQRNSVVNIALERYMDLQNKLDEARINIEWAKKVIEDSDLKTKVMYNDNGQNRLMTYEEARNQYCLNPRSCSIPLNVQIKAISQAESLLAQAEQTLTDLATQVIEAYNEDYRFFEAYNNTSTFIPNNGLGVQLAQLRGDLDLLSNLWQFHFASEHPRIKKRYEVEYLNQNQKDLFRDRLSLLANHFHLMTYDEDKLLELFTSPDRGNSEVCQ